MNRFKERLAQFLKKLSNIGLIGVVLGILVLINYIVSFCPIRIDITENKIYSLSPATKEILTGLDDIVTIKLFFSKDLPNRLLPTKQEVKSLLAEYERVGGGNVKIETVKPSGVQEEQEALSLGIPQLQFSGVEKDKLQVSQGFFGGAVLFAGKSEAIPVFEEGGNFEYKFTSAINKLTRKKVPKVAFAQGHAEEDKGLDMAHKLLAQDFTVTTQTISTSESSLTRSAGKVTIPEDIKTLLVIDPKQNWGSAEKDALARFVNKGGSLFFALDGVSVGNNLLTSPVNHKLFDFLEKYGLSLNKDLVVSSSNDIANFRTQQGMFLTPYPFWVRITPKGFSKEIPATARLETAVFPWVSSISVDKSTRSRLKAQGSKKDNIRVYELIKTVPQSYTMEGNFNLQPNQEFDFKAHSTGSTNSPQADSGQASTGEKIVAAAATVESQTSNVKSQKSADERQEMAEGKIVLVGDAGFLQDSLLQRNQANAVLFLNLVDWLTSNSKLSGIRARASSFRPLVELNDTAKAGVKYANVLVVPALLGILGGIRLYRRK